MSTCEDLDNLENGSLRFITSIKCDSIKPYNGIYKIYTEENQQNYFILLIVGMLVLLLLVYWSNKFPG